MISVIMTVYDEPIKWVEEAIKSIDKQTISSLKLIIVIDNPVYSDLQMINEVCNNTQIDCLIHVNESNVGLVRSLNTGLSYVDTEYVARMDSDDISNYDRFELELKFLKENNLDFVASDVVKVNECKVPINNERTFDKDLYSNDVSKVESLQNVLWHPTWLLKTKVMKELKGYRNIKFAEDYDFILRALLNDFQLGILGKPTVKKRIREGAISEDNGLEQIITANKLAKMFRNKRSLPEKFFISSVSSSDRQKFNFLKNTFNNRRKENINRIFRFLTILLTSKVGFIFLKAIFIQKYGIKLALNR